MTHFSTFLIFIPRSAIANSQLFRHFVKEDLPRIRYANPDLKIEVIKWRKEKNEHWRPELELKFGAFLATPTPLFLFLFLSWFCFSNLFNDR